MGYILFKVINLFEKVFGKVFFIDEVYCFGGGNCVMGYVFYEEEVIGELVDCMIKLWYFCKMIIVLVGYDKDMDNFMKVNVGLRGRFVIEINFFIMMVFKVK